MTIKTQFQELLFITGGSATWECHFGRQFVVFTELNITGTIS